MLDRTGFTNPIDDIAHAHVPREESVTSQHQRMRTSAPADTPERRAAEKADPNIAE